MTKVDLDVRRLFSRPSDGFPCDLMAVTPTAVADAVKRGTAVFDELKQSVRGHLISGASAGIQGELVPVV
jgi:hypothetical protein